MRIVIAGAGSVGRSIAGELLANGHDVTLIEKDPGYTRATARLLLHTIRREILGEEALQSDMATRYAEYFPGYILRSRTLQLERLVDSYEADATFAVCG